MTDEASRRAVTYARCAALVSPDDLPEVAHRLLETLAAESGAKAGALYADEAFLSPRSVVAGTERPKEPPRLVRVAILGPEQRTPGRLPPAAITAVDPDEPVTTPGPRVDVALVLDGQPIGIAWLLDAPGSLDDTTRELLALVAGVGAGALVAARRIENAEREAVVDRRTGAHGFSFFASAATHEIERARRHGRQFALAVVSLEDFATLRQRIGTAAARDVASRAAERARGVLRGSDVLARVEDDELYLLLPETGSVGAFAARARLVTALAPPRVRDSYGPNEPSMPELPPVTVGVAAFPRDGRDLPSLLRACRLRAEMSRTSPWRRLGLEGLPLLRILETLVTRSGDVTITGDAATLTGSATDLNDPDGRVRVTTLTPPAFGALAASLVADVARRGAPGSIDLFGVPEDSSHAMTLAVAATRGVPGLAVRWIEVPRASEAHGDPSVEGTGLRIDTFRGLILCTELGHYALVSVAGADVAPALHASDPELADGLARALRAAHPTAGELR